MIKLRDGWYKCNQCGTALFKRIKNATIGEIGAIALQKGFIYKNSILYSKKDEPLLFCKKECCKQYYDEHGYVNPAVTEALNEVKKDIPQMAAQTARSVAAFQSYLNRFKKK